MASSVRLVSEDQVGRGYGSADLMAAHMVKVAALLEQMNPDLKRRAIATAKALRLATLQMENMRAEVRRVTGDMAHDALTMISREADAEVSKELEAARVATERGPALAASPAAAEAFEAVKKNAKR